MSRQARRALPGLVLWLSAFPACSEQAALNLFPGGSGTSASTLATASGGSSAGGSSATGDGGGANACALGARITTTELALPSEARPSDEYNPLPVAARADSASLLAYRDANEARIRVVLVDQHDVVSGTVFETEAEEVHALMAHDEGGVVVVVREDPDITIPDICEAPCNSLELSRFDGDGNRTMNATLTDKLTVDREGALFMWWFQHTARIAWADDTYGVYFRSTRTLPLPDGLTPRPGDTLRFVDQAGTRLDGGWDFGCIPSWSVRLIHNGVWAAVCHGDTPNAHRFVVLEAGVQRTILLLNGIPPAYRALGGLSARDDDFWLSYLERTGDSVQFHLARITSTPEVVIDNVLPEAVDLDYQNGYVYRAYHAPLGDNLLLGWKTNDRLALAIADGETGLIIDGPIVTDAPIDHFVEFVPFPNGDVGWANAAASGSVTFTRVSACTQ